MGTKNRPAKFDCYKNAEPDEPMFVLLARDEKAPGIVREWVAVRRRQRCKEQDVIDRDLLSDEKELEALAVADAMQKWRTSDP